MEENMYSDKIWHSSDNDDAMKDALIDSLFVTDLLRCTEKYKNFKIDGKVIDLPTGYIPPDSPIVSVGGKAVLMGNLNRGMIILTEARSVYESGIGILAWRKMTSLQLELFEKIIAEKSRELQKQGKKQKYRLNMDVDSIADIVNVVVYTGKKPWNKKTSLDMKDWVTHPKNYEPETKGAKVWLLDIHGLTDEQLERGGEYVKAFAAVVKAGKNAKKFDKAIKENNNALSHFHRGLILAVCAETGFVELERRINAAPTFIVNGMEMVNVCEVWDKMKKTTGTITS